MLADLGVCWDEDTYRAAPWYSQLAASAVRIVGRLGSGFGFTLLTNRNAARQWRDQVSVWA